MTVFMVPRQTSVALLRGAVTWMGRRCEGRQTTCTPRAGRAVGAQDTRHATHRSTRMLVHCVRSYTNTTFDIKKFSGI